MPSIRYSLAAKGEYTPEMAARRLLAAIEERMVSSIVGRYVREGDMASGSELCLECAGAFDRRSSSRARRDVTLLWICETRACTMQGATGCWTPEALNDPHVIYRCQALLDDLMRWA